MKFFKDIIQSIYGHPMSGLWTLFFESGRNVPIEGGTFGVRRMASVFGAHEGGGDLLEKIKGQVIVWYYDDMGLVMGGFTPIDEWTGPAEFDENGVLEWSPEKEPRNDPAFLVEIIHTVKRPGKGEDWQRRGDKAVIARSTLAEVRALLREKYGACRTRKPVYVDGPDGQAKRVGTIFSRIGGEIKGTGRRAKLYVQDWVCVYKLVGHDEDGQPEYEYKPVIRLGTNPA